MSSKKNKLLLEEEKVAKCRRLEQEESGDTPSEPQEIQERTEVESIDGIVAVSTQNQQEDPKQEAVEEDSKPAAVSNLHDKSPILRGGLVTDYPGMR